MTAVIQQAVECVLSLFLIGLVGYVLAKRGWFSPETKAMLPRLVTIVSLPPYLFVNVIRTFSRDELIHLIYGTVVPAISIGLTFGLALTLAKLMKVRPGRKYLFSVSFATSNTIFIGLPVNVTLFGEAALPYVLLYFFANTTFFWTIGNYCLSLDGGRRAPERIFSLATAKRVFSPPLMGFFLGLALILSQTRVPGFIMDAAGYVGSLTTPLAIIFIGITLAGVSLKTLKPDRDVAVLLLGRFVISPLVIIGLIRLIEIPPLMAKVFIIQSSLPVISSAVLLSAYHRSDAHYASAVVSLSTLMSLLTIPLYMVLISAILF
ncbi:MAG: AEC family transporter [Candidatus Adiutrix sp.]|jgi:predicted permease|nr:AEC family transporter [Candidatus Adiutrix sp.]